MCGPCKRGVKYSIVTIFTGVLILNIVGFSPYYSSPTASILIPGLIGITVSVVYFCLRLYKFQHYAFTHFVPKSKSTALGIFIFIVEFMGLLIRAGSLGLRLTCNILCGHLLLSILSVFLLKLHLHAYECSLPFSLGYYISIFPYTTEPIVILFIFLLSIAVYCIKIVIFFIVATILAPIFIFIL